jgi:hypothetical protein
MLPRKVTFWCTFMGHIKRESVEDISACRLSSKGEMSAQNKVVLWQSGARRYLGWNTAFGKDVDPSRIEREKKKKKKWASIGRTNLRNVFIVWKFWCFRFLFNYLEVWRKINVFRLNVVFILLNKVCSRKFRSDTFLLSYIPSRWTQKWR